MPWSSCARPALLDCTSRTSLLGSIATLTNSVGSRIVLSDCTWLMKKGHVLRLLATHHVGKEVSPNVFANNRVSSLVDSGKDFQAIKSE